MTNTDTDPRLGIGGNNPPLAKLISGEENFGDIVTAFLNDEYKDAPQTVAALLEEARALPEKIEDDATKSSYTSLIKRIRDEAKRLDAFQKKEKTPYMRGGQGVDQFFYGMIDKLARRAKDNKAGVADILLARLTDYDTRKLEEERAARAREAARLAAEQAAAAAAAAVAERIERENRERAERARKAEKVEEHTKAAEAAGVVADAAKVDAAVAEQAAEAAHIATLARPADIMRTRGEDGTLSTMATEKYADVLDEALLDKAKLWPFIPLAAKQQALRAYAASTGYTVQMEGASIGKRPKSRVL